MVKEAVRERVRQLTRSVMMSSDLNWFRAQRVAKYLENLGFPKPPEGEPPLLSDEQIQCLDGRNMLPCTEYDRQVAEAQRQLCIKHNREL